MGCGWPPTGNQPHPKCACFFFSFSGSHQAKLLLLNWSFAGCRALYAVCCCNLVTIHYFRQYVIVSTVCVCAPVVHWSLLTVCGPPFNINRLETRKFTVKR